MDIVEVDFERILKTHYFIVTLASSPSDSDYEKNYPTKCVRIFTLINVAISELKYVSGI